MVLGSTRAPSQLVLLPTGTGEQRPLTHDSIHHQGAAWTPDGKRIVFVGNEPTVSTCFPTIKSSSADVAGLAQNRKKEYLPRLGFPGMGSWHVLTLQISLGYDAVARVASCHDPLETIKSEKSIEPMYRCHIGTLVSWVECFT
jgi:WD40-like Beta Propeller Repeat